MGQSEHSRLIDALETQTLQRGLREAGVKLEKNGDTTNVNPSRSDVRTWFQQNDGEVDTVLDDFERGTKLQTLEVLGPKTKNVEEAKGGLNVIADALNLREVYYYKAYFGYTDHTTRVYRTELGGLLEEITEEAESAEQAQEMFLTYCEENNLETYKQAAEEIPAPLITNLGDNSRPRLIHFEDQNHLFVQYWKRGNIITELDIETGDLKNISTVYRPTLRLHLDSGLIESTGDRTDERNTEQIQEFLSAFNGEHTWTSPVDIRSAIETTKDKLALQVSLDEFEGDEDEAKLRFARSDTVSNVEADSKHQDTEEERDRVRSNFQLILGRTPDGWELIYKQAIEEMFSDWDPSDVTLSRVKDMFLDEEPYSEIADFTVSLNGDQDKQTIRVLGKSREPNLYRTVFHFFADELGWQD